MRHLHSGHRKRQAIKIRRRELVHPLPRTECRNLRADVILRIGMLRNLPEEPSHAVCGGIMPSEEQSAVIREVRERGAFRSFKG